MIVVDVFVFLLGLWLGSFFNVVAIRFLNKESIVYPSSHCPHCQRSLAPYELIPVFSYIFLKGKCRSCQARISPLYPIGEGVTALSFYIMYRQIGLTLELLPAAILVAVLMLAVMTDIRKKLILDKITLPGILALGVCRLFIGEHSFWFYLLGSAAGFLLLLFIAVISKGGMGGGDIKLYAAIGFALGPWLTLLSLLIASTLGALVGGVLILSGKMHRKQTIAFGPFIALGAYLSYLFGGAMWTWYIQMW